MKTLAKTEANPMSGSLAPYACDPARSRGRLVSEPEDPTRSPYQRDRDRIIHSAAFRRLEYKTQVFVNHEGDHYRTRLTHSLEVAQLARSISRALGLNEDLAEALALAHDLGHTPFGHAGEDALKDVMEGYGGFDHNAQTLRILTTLEHRYAGFDGLNLTWEALEGIAKHNGPLMGRAATHSELLPNQLPRAIAQYNTLHDLELHSYAGLEAQIASLADDIAYNNHDVDDGLRSGLFTIEEICAVPLAGEMFAQTRKQYPRIDDQRLIHESIRRMIHAMVLDLLGETRLALARSGVASPQEVRGFGAPIAAFSASMQAQMQPLKAFLMQHMYRHWRVNRMTSKARRVVKELFGFFVSEPQCLPSEWQRADDLPGSIQTAQRVADFIAGMTDRFAIEEHGRVFLAQIRS
jgi:dGTPase